MTNRQGQITAAPRDTLNRQPAPAPRDTEAAADHRAEFRELLTADFKKQWRRYRKKLRRCQRKFSERAVHDSRIEARRLLSSIDLLSVFLSAGETEKAHALLKRHLDVSDKLRDTHVQLLYLRKLLRSSPGLHSFQAALVRRERRCIKQTSKQIKRLKLARMARLIDRLDEHLHERSKQSGPRSGGLNRVLRAVGRAFDGVAERRRQIDPANTATIHRTRVAFKKFRYMVEALAPWLPGISPRQIVAMKNYQSLMGDIQDTEVLQASFDCFIAKEKIETASARRFRDRLRRRQARLVAAYLAKADRLNRFWPRRPAGNPVPAPRAGGKSK